MAAAWSPPDAPASWELTAETFRALAEEDPLVDLAAALPADRLPPLLLSAAVRLLVTRHRPEPLIGRYPVPGGGQPDLGDGFRPALVAFCQEHRAELASVCADHRYQMTEVARCLDVLPVLATIADEDPRPIALVDLGTGAGLGLHPDCYAYRYALPDGQVLTCGDPAATVTLAGAVRPGGRPPVPPRPPALAHRVGVDAEPLDLGDPATAEWLAACVPPEAGALTRFAAAAAHARAHPAPTVRGDLVDALPAVIADLPGGVLVCLVDTYVNVFLPPPRLAAFRALVADLGRERDLEWISVDPLVPLGPDATATVQGLPVPAGWLADNHAGGVFGVVGRVSVRGGRTTGSVLGRAHPAAAWLDWRA